MAFGQLDVEQLAQQRAEADLVAMPSKGGGDGSIEQRLCLFSVGVVQAFLILLGRMGVLQNVGIGDELDEGLHLIGRESERIYQPGVLSIGNLQ
jgi:hypothetical protein